MNCGRAVNRFLSLGNVIIEFSCVFIICDDPDGPWTQAVEETTFMNTRFFLLFSRHLVIQRIQPRGSPTLKHLQNYNYERIVKFPNFNEALGRLSELRPTVVTEFNTSYPENN